MNDMFRDTDVKVASPLEMQRILNEARRYRSEEIGRIMGLGLVATRKGSARLLRGFAHVTLVISKAAARRSTSLAPRLLQDRGRCD
ncbi:hypothetical protein [Sneathiella sp.]|uniref:hypothetical protein n=1 Tax=Sneathiella sp. TaxID=1964365 RepID=UPI00356830DF